MNDRSTEMGGNHIVMNIYNNPLTEAEEKELHGLSQSPDPLTRLQGNYYQLRQRQVMARYADDLTSKKYHDATDRKNLQERLMDELTEMRREYELDVDNAIQLHLAMIGVVSWRPSPAA